VRVVALGQHFAAGEHGDVVGQRRYDRQVVLDHQHGPVRRHLADQRGDALDVLVRHPGRRLVQQHHLGIEREVVAISSARLRPYGSSTACVPANSVRPTASISSSARSWCAASFFSDARNRTSGRAPLQRDADVLEHGEIGKHGGDLERAHETHPAIAAGREPVISRPCRRSGRAWRQESA
jgi:hypothetical protein